MKPAPVRILLIEDNEADSLLLREELAAATDFRHSIGQASTLAAGIASLATQPVDVVLLDLGLPDSQGLDTVRRLHDAAPDLPIIVLTGLEDDDLALRAMHVGAQDYWVKGTADARLAVRAIRYAIERRRAEIQRQQLARAHAGRFEAEEAERRAWLVAEVGQALSASLDYGSTLQTVANLLVPRLGMLCCVDVLSAQGQAERVAVAHAPAELSELARALSSNPPRLERDDHPLVEAMRSKTEVHRSIDDEAMATLASDEAHLKVLAPLRNGQLLATPFEHGRARGVLSLVRLAQQRSFDTNDRTLVWEAASRIGMAVENARLYREAQQAVGHRDEILAVISHDLRNPLQSLRYSLDALEAYGGIAPVVRIAHVMKRSIRHMEELLSNLLTLSRMRDGQLTVSAIPCEVVELLQEATEINRPAASARSVSIFLRGDERRFEVSADRYRLFQVVSNLLSNAVKFSPAGSTVVVDVQPVATALRISVTDQGPGVPDADRQHIFDKYWRTQGERGGEGLGLAIAKSIVEAHGGVIGVDCPPTGGSTFWFTLPMRGARSNASEPPSLHGAP